MSRARSESDPIINWSSPDPNSALGRTKSQTTDLAWINLKLGLPRSKCD